MYCMLQQDQMNYHVEMRSILESSEVCVNSLKKAAEDVFVSANGERLLHSLTKPINVDISGVPGTGKTATVHAVVRELKRMAENDVSINHN
jgi:Cdc6-like AAA superfamily ATPase